MVLSKSSEDFPRSEKPERAVKQVNRGFVKRQSEQLFKKKNLKPATVSKPRDNQKKRNRKKNENDNNNEKKKKGIQNDGENGIAKANLNKVAIEFMDISKLPEGMLVYGCIEEIGDFELRFCVTGGISVKVPITNISRSYTKLIERFTNDSNDNPSEEMELVKLDTMFQIGDYYAVKIVSKSSTPQFGHTDVIGSINPADIYEGFNVKTFNNLPAGYPLIGSVSAIEDYGYGIDFGVENVKAFLSFEENKKANNNNKLNIGQLVHCTILRADDRSIMVTNNKKKIGTVLDLDSQVSILNFVPGTKTQVTVTGIQKAGLELSLPGEYKGFVPQYHISDDLSTEKKIELNEVHTGTVLYVQPFTKQICISLKQNLSKKIIKNFQNIFHFGMLIKNAVVCGKGMMGSIIFRVNSNHYAYCRRKNLAEASELEGMDIDKRFKIGSSHLAKVKSFNLFENLVEISLKKSFIEKETLDIHQLTVCQKVDCTVKRHDPKGIFVKLGPGIDGFVPLKHLTDAPFKNMNMEKMFPLKSTVKCRIMKLDIHSKTPRISLTMKKSLLNLSEEEIFTNFDDIQPGMTSTGVVCLIQQQGILVEFFGSVAAFIPLKNLATYKIEYPEKVFTVGQLVKVTIVVVNPDRRRMVGSLIDIKLNKKKDQSPSGNEKLVVGQMLKKMKISDKIKTDGIDLVNSEGTVKVFLPVGHLSDDPYLSQLIFMSLKVDDIIDNVMVFRKDLTNAVVCTKKPVFIDYSLSEDKNLVKSEDDIELKVPFPAVIRNITENGVFFEIPGGNCGVLRKKYFQDQFYGEPEKLGLKKHQTIFVTAIESLSNFAEETDPKKAQQLKKYKFSMRLSDVWNKTDASKTDFMQNYLLNQEWIKQMLAKNDDQTKTVVVGMKKLVQYQIGAIVKYTITKINETNFELKVGTGKNTILGFASKWNEEFNSFNIDQVGEAIVCDYDFENNALRVFIPPTKSTLLKHIKAYNSTNSTKNNVKIDQVIKGTILWIGNRHLLVCLAGHVPGAIAFVPTRRHYNDCGEIEALFTVGSEHHFKITKIVNDEKIVGVLSSEAKSEANKAETKKKKAKMTDKEKKEKIEARRAEKKAKKALLRNERRLAKLGKLGTEPIKDKGDKKEISSASEEFQWDIPDPTPNLGKKRKLTLDDIPDSDNDHLSSDEFEDEDDAENKTKKRKTKSELSEERKKREKELRDTENNLSDPKRKLKTEQDFEMAIIGQPNSSILWLKFMSFYLEKGNVDKARAIADRALERISFREEKEKLNIWIGLLNLENSYGDQDSMDKVLEKALKYNDPKSIYLQLASIYELSEKPAKAEEIFQIALRKFKQEKSVWIEYLVFLMKANRIDFARKQFQKSLLSVDKREHVDMISKFAQLEFKFGDSEQAKTIFEQMLATYPKRLDQWSIYIDMLIKYTFNPNDKDSSEYIRNIFERLISLKLSAERMKFVFKKFTDFEEKLPKV